MKANLQEVTSEEIKTEDLNFDQLKDLEEIVTPGVGSVGCC